MKVHCCWAQLQVIVKNMMIPLLLILSLCSILFSLLTSNDAKHKFSLQWQFGFILIPLSAVL